LPFGHNQCVCFTETPAGDALLKPPREPLGHSCRSKEAKCCRCLAIKEPHRQGQFLPPLDDYSKAPRGSGHCYSCSECDTKYTWMRSNTLTPGRVYLLVSKNITISASKGPRSSRWLSSVDPESWGITDDETLRHFAWCSDAQCPTRSRWSRLLYLYRKETSREDGRLETRSTRARTAEQRSWKLRELGRWTEDSGASGSNGFLSAPGSPIPPGEGDSVSTPTSQTTAQL
jgi:hypothetical protein